MKVRQLMANPSTDGERCQLACDIAAMLRINVQYSRKTSPERIRRFSSSGAGVYLVAEERGQVVGFLLMAMAPEGAAIMDVETNTHHLGSGVTRLLIEKAQELAVLRGVHRFYKLRA